LVLEPGSYWIRASNKIQTSTFYNLTLTSAEPFIPPPDLVGNTLVQAKDLGTLPPVNSSVNFSETVWVGDTSDCYRFNLNEPQDVHVLLSGLNGDADVQLIQDINSNGLVEQNEIIRQSNTQLNQNGSLDFLGLDSGTYYLGISPRHQDTWYNLSLSTGFNSNSGYGIANAAAAVAKATGLNIPFDVNTPVRNDNTWEQQILHVHEVWDQGITGQNIVVAVLDTGVDYNHLDLKDNIWTNSKEIPDNGIDDDGNRRTDDFRGWDFVNNDYMPMDEYLHGTHVAGIIAAENNGWGITGVAYNAKIMPVRIAIDQGNAINYENLIKGINYAVDNGANIINMSLARFRDYPLLQDALQYAESKGVLCVISAGNDNQNEPDYPARYADKWGIAVGAIDQNGIMTDFSNHAGSTPVNYVLAPGQYVDSTIPNNQFKQFPGTSMAAPYVAAIAALILSANPTLTPDQLKKIILQTTTPLPQTKIA
jgi:subtilisin family serine protease